MLFSRAAAIVPARQRQAARDDGKPALVPETLTKVVPKEAGRRKVTRFEGVALRCEKTKRTFAPFVVLATGFILLRSAHKA